MILYCIMNKIPTNTKIIRPICLDKKTKLHDMPKTNDSNLCFLEGSGKNNNISHNVNAIINKNKDSGRGFIPIRKKR